MSDNERTHFLTPHPFIACINIYLHWTNTCNYDLKRSLFQTEEFELVMGKLKSTSVATFFHYLFFKEILLIFIIRNLKIHDVTDTVLYSLAGITIKNISAYYSEEG